MRHSRLVAMMVFPAPVVMVSSTWAGSQICCQHIWVVRSAIGLPPFQEKISRS